MRDAVIVEAIRTPIGKRNGGLAGVHPVDLSALVLRSLSDRTGIDPALVDDVIWGCVGQVGEQTFDIARTAVLAAGWPESVPGVTIDRQCGSSQQAVHFAAAGLIAARGGLSRARLDEYSLASHEKAAAAQDAGLLDAQIVPVPAELTGRGGLL